MANVKRRIRLVTIEEAKKASAEGYCVVWRPDENPEGAGVFEYEKDSPLTVVQATEPQPLS